MLCQSAALAGRVDYPRAVATAVTRAVFRVSLRRVAGILGHVAQHRFFVRKKSSRLVVERGDSRPLDWLAGGTGV